MQRVISGSKVDPEFFFGRFCKSDGTHTKMSNEDFSRMVKELYEKVTKAEILHVFHHFDKGRKGYITKQDFV
jgi:Ca2+-binding EF-hand superfamily protein